jgi:hypothetical protein
MLLTLQTTDATVGLETVTDPCLFTRVNPRTAAARRVRESLGPERTQGRALLCDSLQGVAKTDKAEVEAWEDWRGSRVSPKRFLGEGIVAGAAWQCVVAAEMLRRNLCDESLVNVVGCNQQAIGARFSRVRNS